jgi:hypothetical protein
MSQIAMQMVPTTTTLMTVLLNLFYFPSFSPWRNVPSNLQ